MVESGQIFVAQVGSGQPSLVWVWKISLDKIPNFSIFCPLGPKKSHRVCSKSTQVEAGLASYLLQVKSMFGTGRVRAHL